MRLAYWCKELGFEGVGGGVGVGGGRCVVQGGGLVGVGVVDWGGGGGGGVNCALDSLTPMFKSDSKQFGIEPANLICSTT